MSPETLNKRVATAISSRNLIAEPTRRGRFLERRPCVGIPAPSLARGIVDLVWALNLTDDDYIPLVMRLAREGRFDPVKALAYFPRIAWLLKDEK